MTPFFVIYSQKKTHLYTQGTYLKLHHVLVIQSIFNFLKIVKETYYEVHKLFVRQYCSTVLLGSKPA